MWPPGETSAGGGGEVTRVDKAGARAEALLNSRTGAVGGGGGYGRRGSLGSLPSSTMAIGLAMGAEPATPKGIPAMRLAVHKLLEETATASAPADARGSLGAPPLHASAPPPPPPHRRKFSFPAALHSNLLGLAAAGPGAGAGAGAGEGAALAAAARRRLSNVSDAVSRKLSHTLGWRVAGGGAGVSAGVGAALAQQARALCALYVRLRLRRDGLFTRRCGLRLRLGSAGAGAGAREAFPVLAAVGGELERLHARAFTSVARQTGAAPGGGALPHDKAAACALAAVARELCKQPVTWGKVVALFCVAGALAADCARQGRPDFAAALPDAVAEAVEEELAPWIHSNGGWAGLSAHFRPAGTEVAVGRRVVCVLGALALCVLLLALLLRSCGVPTNL